MKLTAWNVIALLLWGAFGIWAWVKSNHWSAKVVVVLFLLNVISNMIEPEYYKRLYSGQTGNETES